jgi:hypothetical protein
VNAGAAGVDLPDLRIVPLVSLVLHEDADERRTNLLRQRLTVEQVVKNPPLVTPLDATRFVVLDGANRTSALQLIGVRDVLVQVVDYDTVTLTTWFHLVAGVPSDQLVAALRDVAGGRMTESTLDAARRDLEAGRVAAYAVVPSGQVFAISTADPEAAVPLLQRVVATYRGRADIFRVQTDELEALAGFYSEIAAVVVFPPYKPADILALAGREAKLPTGITRHLVPHRALRLHTELALLWSDTPLGEKNRWLAEWTRHKLQAGEIRYYQESTVLYDE